MDCRAGPGNDAWYEYAALADAVLVYHLQRSVFLQPCHEPATSIVELRPPAVIVKPEIEYVRRAGLDRHSLGRRDVVDVGRGHRKIHRPIRVRIVHHVHLGSEHLSRECRPVRAKAGELHTCGINEPDRILGRPPQSATGLHQHRCRQFGKYLPRSLAIGIRHRRTLHSSSTQMIKPRLVAFQPGRYHFPASSSAWARGPSSVSLARSSGLVRLPVLVSSSRIQASLSMGIGISGVIAE